MGRGERVNGMEKVLSYPHLQRMDEGLARARGCGWELPCIYYKIWVSFQPLSSSIHWRMGWTSWAGFQF